MSRFGRWAEADGLPVFAYDVNPDATPEARWDPLVGGETSRHWAVIGNRRISLVVDNYGGVALADEHDGIRFVTAPDPNGTGMSSIDGAPTTIVRRRIGPTWFDIDCTADGVRLTRTVQLPDGEQPWVLVRVAITSSRAAGRSLVHTEHWAVRPRWMTLAREPDAAAVNARAAISYQTSCAGRRVTALEKRNVEGERLASLRRPAIFGAPHRVVLEAVGPTEGTAWSTGDAHPELEVTTPVTLGPGETVVLWFRFGLDTDEEIDDPAIVLERSRASLAARLPRAAAAAAPMARREVPWHAALLTGGACTDGVLGGHTLDQGSAYSYVMGFNGAARDPLQHAMPLVYIEPDLALSVLRNTCAWSAPNGDLPYALDGSKRVWTSRWQPSDQNIWALWLAAEYAAATGDLGAFGEEVGFHPMHGAGPVPLAEHLRRQFAFLVDGVGRGEHGHLRIMNADWNDVAISTSGVPHDAMIEKGESVLNSAMAAWVLPRYAGLCDRLGDSGTAGEARSLGEELRLAVAGEWNGRWFRRAYGPGADAIGDEDMWLEVQPWAILCGAADKDQARALLQGLDAGCRAGSPLGARVRWPITDADGLGGIGEATSGGIWYSINATLVWAAAAVDPALAWDEWRRMSLTAHGAAYPSVWEGTVSGPDCYNAPESARPGRTWGLPELGVGMQAFPVGNLHSHAQPLLAYLRLLGVEPAPDGSLRVAGADGARFESSVFAVEPDGSGRVVAAGPVDIDCRGRRVVGGPGEVRW